MRTLRALAPLALIFAVGCGDIGRVVLDLSFANEDLELRTRALRIVVREVGEGGDGCGNLWVQTPTGLAEDSRVLDYPNRVDVRVSPVDLERYPSLTLLVYAYPSADTETSQPIAGGCAEQAVDAAASNDIAVLLEAPPS